MEIAVKSIKVLKTGKNDFGDWKLVKLNTVDDVEYTTLADGAEMIMPSSLIEITNMDEDKKGQKSFKKFKVISEGHVSSPQETTNGNGEPTEKRNSIENQTRAYIIADLYKAEKLEAKSSQVVSLLVWLDKLGSPDKKAKAEEELWGSKQEESGERTVEQQNQETDWYTQSLKKIKWSETTVKSYLENKYQVDKSGSIFDVIGRLNQEQEAEFVQEIKSRMV